MSQGIHTMGHKGLYVACPMSALPREERTFMFPQDWFVPTARPSRRDDSPRQGPSLT